MAKTNEEDVEQEDVAVADGIADVKVEQQLRTARPFSVTTALSTDTMLNSVLKEPAVQQAVVLGRA